jgi:hypothetical protein
MEIKNGIVLKIFNFVSFNNTTVIIFIVFLITGCSIPQKHIIKEQIPKPISTESAILVLGIELIGKDATSAAISLNANGKVDVGGGNLIKGENPSKSSKRNSPSSDNIINKIYTGGGDHGYVVFDLPIILDGKKSSQYLLYISGIRFTTIQSVHPGTPGSIIGTLKSGEKGWWKAYEFTFWGPMGWMTRHPIGYKEDPNFKFYACKFEINKPGIYYLGELKIETNLTISENNQNGNLGSKPFSMGSKLLNATANGNISSYIDLEKFRRFLNLNGIDENNFIDFSKYCREISQAEYLNF